MHNKKYLTFWNGLKYNLKLDANVYDDLIEIIHVSNKNYFELRNHLKNHYVILKGNITSFLK